MSIPKTDIEAFEAIVTNEFSFLEDDYGLRYAGLNVVCEDPRDSHVIAKYRQDDFRIDIAWNPFEKSIGVFIRLISTDLTRRERYIYLEPFIEFSTNGIVTPIVPHIYPGMGVNKIAEAIDLRSQRLVNGVGEVLGAVASRLKEYYEMIRNASVENIRQYQRWYQARGKDA